MLRKFIILLALLLLAACAPEEPQTPTAPGPAPTGVDPQASLTPSRLPPTTAPSPSAVPSETPLVAPSETPVPTETAPPPGTGRTDNPLLDVTYCSPAGTIQQMDLYFPPGNGGPAPAVIYIHGGGLTGGDKQQGAGMADIPILVEAGFIVASINYRLAPAFTFPAQLEDAKCAVRFLRSTAFEFGLDPERIGVYGTSAGGYLAAMLGVTQPEDGFEGSDEHGAYSSSVQAVATMFAYTLLIDEGLSFSPVYGPINADILARYSAVTHADAGDPPFLLLHGSKDTVVPPSQSEFLYLALHEAGGQANLLIVDNGGHGFERTDPPMQPSRMEISRLMADFFSQHLRRLP